MTATLSQSEVFEQEQEEFAIVSTTFNNRTAQKFPSRPIAIVRSIRSIAQTSVKDIDTDAKSYYISSRLIDFANIFLPPQPYELRAIEDQYKEFRSDDIAVHSLTHSILRQNVSFVQLLSNSKRGRFLTSSSNSLPKGLPRSQSKHQNLETIVDSEMDEEVPFWRGVFALPSSTDVIFSKRIEVKINELPSWEPHIVIDSYRFEDDDE